MDNLPDSNRYVACRRCDECGTRASVKSEDEDQCLLECTICGKEYPFYKSPREDRLTRTMKSFRNTPESDVYDIIIVGGGPGGLSAGIYAMRAAMKTVLIEKGNLGGQMAISKGIENYPGFMDINGFDLSEKFLQHARSYGLETLREEVIAIEPNIGFHAVRLANGTVLDAYSVILAAGGTARRLGIPGEVEYMGRGVSYCATCDGLFFKNKEVAVVGGGDTALEEALYLSKISSRVHLIHRREEFRASRILQQRVGMESKINLVLNSEVISINSKGNGVSWIALRDTKGYESRLDVEGIFIFIGRMDS